MQLHIPRKIGQLYIPLLKIYCSMSAKYFKNRLICDKVRSKETVDPFY